MLKTSHQKTEAAMNPPRMRRRKGSWGFGVSLIQCLLGSIAEAVANKAINNPLTLVATSREISAPTAIGFIIYPARPGIAAQKSVNPKASVGSVPRKKRELRDGERLLTKRLRELAGYS
jgi:hypothetical protein